MYLQAYLFEIEEHSSVSYILRNFKKYFKILNTAAYEEILFQKHLVSLDL